MRACFYYQALHPLMSVPRQVRVLTEFARVHHIARARELFPDEMFGQCAASLAVQSLARGAADFVLVASRKSKPARYCCKTFVPELRQTIADVSARFGPDGSRKTGDISTVVVADFRPGFEIAWQQLRRINQEDEEALWGYPVKHLCEVISLLHRKESL